MIARVLLLLAASGCRSLLGFEELADPTAPLPDDGSPPADLTVPTDDLTDPLPDAFVCPANYDIELTGSTSRYRFVSNQSVPWLTANTRCGDDGQHLIVLGSPGELSAINVVAGAGQRWVGLSDRAAEGVYLPVTDEPTTFPPLTTPPWAAGEPSVDEAADCTLMNDGGQLLAVPCGNGRTYICECDGFAIAPANF